MLSTKHNLDSFKGHFHIGIEDVHIESEIYEGVEFEVFQLTASLNSSLFFILQ